MIQDPGEQTHETDYNEDDEEIIGRPNWAERDREDDEDDDDVPTSFGTERPDGEEEQSGSGEEGENTPFEQAGSEISVSGDQEDDDTTEYGVSNTSQSNPWSLEGLRTSITDASETNRQLEEDGGESSENRFDIAEGNVKADYEDDATEAGSYQDQIIEASDQQVSEAPIIDWSVGADVFDPAEYDNTLKAEALEAGNVEVSLDEPVVLPEGWQESVEAVFTRWTGYNSRQMSNEAVKTSLILPMLSGLGYNVFDLDQFEPVDNPEGQHEGYLVSALNGKFVLLFNDAPKNRYADGVTMTVSADAVKVGVWMDQAGEKSWQPAIEVNIDEQGSAHSLARVHRQAFDINSITSLAELIHGQQDDIVDAVREVITVPGAGFVNDVREKLIAQGHQNPVMLAERIAAAVNKMLSSAAPAAAQESEAPSETDDQGRRALSAAENRALEVIRELCLPEIDPSDIVPRPGSSYTGVLYKDNNRRTIVRLHFLAASVKYVGVFAGNEEKKIKVDTAEDIKELRDAIRNRLKELEPEAF